MSMNRGPRPANRLQGGEELASMQRLLPILSGNSVRQRTYEKNVRICAGIEPFIGYTGLRGSGAMRASEQNRTRMWRTFELQLRAAANLSR